MKNRWFTKRPEATTSANFGAEWKQCLYVNLCPVRWFSALKRSSLLVCADTSGAQETAMDTSDDSSSFKEYEPPPPSASGVATRCEMPAQPLVGNL